jgi:diaminohydroxyphosphoribosylaminopyrimidine deaminase / 5-amino-6-(5-phosphoribosylamino)uracil reductase
VKGDGSPEDIRFMRQALRLAQRAYGMTSPNPMVGAVLVKRGKTIGRGWHHRAGEPHAEIEVLRDAERRGHDARGATLYVTLEPCSTHGRTPPCTTAIREAGIAKVIVGAVDPNPKHAGKGCTILERAGIKVRRGVLEAESTRLNEVFNHWIVHGTPFVTVKAGMSLDGKIATRTGESRWITSAASRGRAMKLRLGSDAILVGVNTIVRDDPSLTVRIAGVSKRLRRIVLDTNARTPLQSQILNDADAELTTIVVGRAVSAKAIAGLERKVRVWRAPVRGGRIDLRWLMNELGGEVTSLLVEGGGEVNERFLLGGFAHRVAFFYAPLLIGGADAVKAVAGKGITDVASAVRLRDVEWERTGPDWLLSGRLSN